MIERPTRGRGGRNGRQKKRNSTFHKGLLALFSLCVLGMAKFHSQLGLEKDLNKEKMVAESRKEMQEVKNASGGKNSSSNESHVKVSKICLRKRANIMHHASNTKECVTLSQRKDGFGMRYLGVMSGVAWAAWTNRSYCHTPFESQSTHNEDIKVANKVIGFYKGKDCSKCAVGRNGIFKHAFFEKQESIDVIFNECIRSQLREKFDKGISALGIENPVGERKGYLNVAVHVRRGDIMDVEKETLYGKRRYTSMEQTAEMMNAIREKFGDQKLLFNVFSEGLAKEFSILTDGHDDVQLHLLGINGMWTTYFSFVHADILLMAKSSFSFTAAALRNGTKATLVFYPLPWTLPYKPLISWHGLS
mmetsp:Transcript_6964/g.10626  ORF Transcript_6964/g.10626 Transcript_6964/m.10626 type:complete len:362 (-) Transcript_6964:143-1228(-)